MMDDRTWADNKLLREMAIAEENERKAVTPAPQFGEPWTYNEDTESVRDCKGHGVMNCEQHYPLAVDPDSQERCVACVNAMANIPDPQGFINELKEALEDAIELIHGEFEGAGWTREENNRLRALLARLDASRGSR